LILRKLKEIENQQKIIFINFNIKNINKKQKMKMKKNIIFFNGLLIFERNYKKI